MNGTSENRIHHLLKTFWAGDRGWQLRLQPDGTAHWTDPEGHTHTTTPGSRLLFPTLSTPVAPLDTCTTTPPPAHTAGLTMPRRRTTRAHDRTNRIHHERQLNHRELLHRPSPPSSSTVGAQPAHNPLA